MLKAQVVTGAQAANRETTLRSSLARSLWQWLTVAMLLALIFPAARGDSAWFGQGALWLLGMPLTSLMMFYRHALAAAWHGILVPAPRRRRPMTFVPLAVRDSVRDPRSEAGNATHYNALPGRRPARQQRRSPCHDRRSLPVAGRC